MITHHGGMIVDMGNVIIAYRLSNISQENFNDIDYSSIPEVDDVCESLKRFNDYFEGNITVVYKATAVATEKVFAWLKTHHFCERTGITLNRIQHTKTGRDKSPHIQQSSASYYGTTVVVDDRLEVLSHFVGKSIPHLFLFQPVSSEIEQFGHTGALSHVRVVQTWKEIELSLFQG